MSTLLAHPFPIATVVLYFLKKLSVLCRHCGNEAAKGMVKNSLSGALPAIPQQNTTITFHHTAQKTALYDKKTL